MINDMDSTALSMIDCGIKSLKDVPLKYNLTSVNLHSNQLTRIENLTYLKHLVYLDLSSNQIVKISGLNGLLSLKVLNLSCNCIVTIENLGDLKKLTYLNLSYNKLQHVNGLNELWGGEHSLETLLLNSNFIASHEDLSYFLYGLVKLKHLNIADNKISRIGADEFRTLLFKNMKSMITVDNRDRAGKMIGQKLAPQTTGLFDESISLPASTVSQFKKINHKISSDETVEDLDETVSSLGPKLDMVEDKIHKLLLLRDRLKMNDDENDHPHFKDRSNNLSSESKSKRLIGILKPSSSTNVQLKSPAKTEQPSSSPQTPLECSNNNNNNNNTSNSNNSNNSDGTNALTEIVKLLQNQLNDYRLSQEANLKLINELKANLHDVEQEKSKCLCEKDALISRTNDINSKLSGQISELKIKIEQTEQKLEASQTNTEAQMKKRDEKLKQTYVGQLKSQKDQYEIQLKQMQDKINSLELSYKSLEDEFRAALIIESNRYNEACHKLDLASQENVSLKSTLSQLTLSEERHKSLINELNDLIKEQKSRIQSLVRFRKENSEDIQKRNSKLSEAVSDCVKFKQQYEQVKREKSELEASVRKMLTDYEKLKLERDTWSTKLNEQKNFFLTENDRLEVENKKLLADVTRLNENFKKEEDACKIKTKIIEDQTETIKKLKNALLERDDLIKKNRDESLETQKSLEKQLNDEMDFSNELKIKLEKANEKRDLLKLELEKCSLNLNETKLAYDELATKWKQKSDLIGELDSKVRKMKESYEKKENELIEKNAKIIEENKQLNGKLRKLDDDFRALYDVEKKEHLKALEKLKHEYEAKLIESERRVAEIEDEMRTLLVESENKKKFYDEKIKNFSMMFSKFQADLKVDN